MKITTSLLLTLSLVALVGQAATIVPIRISDEPRTTTVSTNDDVLINATNAGTGTWTTKRATVGKVAEASQPLLLPIVTNAIDGKIQAATNELPALITSIAAATTNASGYQPKLFGPAIYTPLGVGYAPEPLIFTNIGGILGPPYTNWFTLIWPSNSIKQHFKGANNHTGEFSWWPDHGQGFPEFLLGAEGNLRLAFRHIQYGVPDWSQNMWTYENGQQWGANALSTNNLLCQMHLYEARYWSAPGVSNIAGIISRQEYRPGTLFKAEGTNGNAAFGWYSELAFPTDTGEPSEIGAIRQHALLVGPSPGFSFSGGLTNNGVGGISTEVLLADGNYLEIQNGLVIACRAADADAQSYMTRAGVTNTGHKAAIDNFVVGLKRDGLWTNLYALWPLYGTNGTQSGQNLLSTNYTVTWNGDLSGSTNHSLTGVTNNGAASSWGDTGFNPSTAGVNVTNFHMMVWSETSPTVGGGGYSGSSGSAIGVWGNTPAYSLTTIMLDTNTVWVYGPLSGLATPVGSYVYGAGAGVGFVYADTVKVHDCFGANTLTSGGGPAGENTMNKTIGLFCYNMGGSVAAVLASKLSGASLGTVLSTADIAKYRTRWQTLQTALGR